MDNFMLAALSYTVKKTDVVSCGTQTSMKEIPGRTWRNVELYLHNIGYLHRDVKPGNYTIGRPELNELRKVYILDFRGLFANHDKRLGSVGPYVMLQYPVTFKESSAGTIIQ
ncbi:hypothetical protein COOONC_20832 [Cooperia oncophora]